MELMAIRIFVKIRISSISRLGSRKIKMKPQTPLILTLIVETFLLILVFIVVFVGVLGIFLPILPGVVLVGVGIGLYSLLIKSDYSKITPRFHRFAVKRRDKIFKLKITQNFMGLIKKAKKRNGEKVKEEILRHGLVLLGFNTALIFAFLFGFIGLSLIASLFQWRGLVIAFIPLLIIFVFAGSSAVIWYRFGQILGNHLKKRKVINSALVVLISILPLLVVLMLLSAMISSVGGFASEIIVVVFLGFVLMSILAAVFELLIVSLGMMTKVK